MNARSRLSVSRPTVNAALTTVPRAAMRRTPPVTPGGSLSRVDHGSLRCRVRAAPRSAARSPTSPTAARARGTARARLAEVERLLDRARPASRGRPARTAARPRASRSRARAPERAATTGVPAASASTSTTPKRLLDRRQHGHVRARRGARATAAVGSPSTHSAPSGRSSANHGSRLPASTRRASGPPSRALGERLEKQRAAACAGRPGCRCRRSSAPSRVARRPRSRALDPGRHHLGLRAAGSARTARRRPR